VLVNSLNLRQLKAYFVIAKRSLWRKKSVVLRVLAAWMVGAIFLFVNQQNDFDVRLQIRNAQKFDKQVVVVLLPRQEWARLQGQNLNYFRPFKDTSYFSDSFFWNAQLWQNLLQKILIQNPRTIGVGIYFGENIPRPSDEILLSPTFNNPKIVWSTQLDSEGRILNSRFARTYSRQAGMNEITVDRDGIVRRFVDAGEPIPHMISQLLKQAEVKSGTLSQLPKQSPLINFRGRARTFEVVTAEKILNGKIPDNFLKNKIIIIGGLDSEGQNFQTPIGPMSRAEILANVVDNQINNRWPQALATWQSLILILIFVIFAALVTSLYPQTLALFMLIFSITLYSGFSIWLFDQFYFWLPIVTIFVTVFATTIIFISFQLTMKDYVNLQLEKEREFLISVEELKNNFLSLISHDLKTPIAKIQAICDRMMLDAQTESRQEDLTALRTEATELHRYIHTILQITRVESRDFRIRKEASDLNELIETAFERLQALAANKRISLNAELEPMFLIEVDPVLIGEVILNLIENAIQYTPEGGRVLVTSRDIDGDILFMVEDNGPGIPASEQQHIFEKFFRGELGRNKPKGSGLGLYLVKYFIELHKGQVFLDSQLNVGTKVGFRLPNQTIDQSVGEENVVES
jgi:two-component system, OmpR family, phosphate regulon sensor histidine kinase PhoR